MNKVKKKHWALEWKKLEKSKLNVKKNSKLNKKLKKREHFFLYQTYNTPPTFSDHQCIDTANNGPNHMIFGLFMFQTMVYSGPKQKHSFDYNNLTVIIWLSCCRPISHPIPPSIVSQITGARFDWIYVTGLLSAGLVFFSYQTNRGKKRWAINNLP